MLTRRSNLHCMLLLSVSRTANLKLISHWMIFGSNWKNWRGLRHRRKRQHRAVPTVAARVQPTSVSTQAMEGQLPLIWRDVSLNVIVFLHLSLPASPYHMPHMVHLLLTLTTAMGDTPCSGCARCKGAMCVSTRCI
jgi:hypothetical protein